MKRSLLVLVLVLAVFWRPMPAYAFVDNAGYLPPLIQNAPAYAGTMVAAGAATVGGAAAVGAALAPAAGVGAVILGGLAIGWAIVEAVKWAWPDSGAPEPRVIEELWTWGSRQAGYDHQIPGSWVNSQTLWFTTGGVAGGTQILVSIRCYRPSTGTLDNLSSAAYLNPASTVNQLIQCPTAGDVLYMVKMSTSGTTNTIGSFETYGAKTEPTYGQYQVQATGTCRDASGATTTAGANSVLFSPSDPNPPIPAVSCPAGSRLVEHSANLVTIDPSNGAQLGAAEPLTDTWTAPEWLPEHQASYADCLSGPGCRLKLQVLEPEGWVDCSVATCEQWLTWPESTRDARLRCWWGPYQLPLNQCATLGPYYNPDTQGQTSTTTKTEPDLDDPAHQQPSKPGVATPPDGTSTTVKRCNSVVLALKCAFLPSEATKTRMAALGDSWSSKPPISIYTATVGAIEPLQTVGGSTACPTWLAKVKDAFSGSIVCDHGFTNAIRDVRGVILVGMVALAFGRLMWSLWYAGVPVLKPSRGGS